MSTTAEQSPRLPLNEMIQIVRAELLKAVEQREKEDQRIEFSLDEIKLEINFVVEQAEKIEAGISGKLWVLVGLKAGAEKDYKREQVHKVELTLRAVDKNSPTPVRAPRHSPRLSVPEGIRFAKPVVLLKQKTDWPDLSDYVSNLMKRRRPGGKGGVKVKIAAIKDALKGVDLSETSLTKFNTDFGKKTGLVVFPAAAFTKGAKFSATTPTIRGLTTD